MDGDVCLGDPVDLWAGLEPRFMSSGCPWRVPQGRPLRTELPRIPPDPVEWDPPSLSLHQGLADLQSHIFDYGVAPMVGLEGPHCIPAGALMAGKSTAALEARLRMNLKTGTGATYLLARLTGKRGTQYFTPEWEGLNRKRKILEWRTPEGRSALARLRLRRMRHEGPEFYGDIAAGQAKRYIEYFDDFGTHIIRSLTYGECLFQVFEVNADLLHGLRAAFSREPTQCRVSGPMAFGMASFTRPPWVTKASPILSASESPEAQRIAHHPLWLGGRPEEDPSLLAPGAAAASTRAAALAMLPARSVVVVSFACQALYLEDHRADAWSRIMRAGLCQRFPDVRLSGWRRRESFPLAPFWASAALTGEESLCKPAQPVLPDIALALDATAPDRTTKLPSDCLAVFAATDPGTGRAAEVNVQGPAFDPERLKIPFLDGAICITDARGGRWCLVEGVWLGPTDSGRPGMVGDPAAPDAALLLRHAVSLSGYLHLMGQVQGDGFPPETAAAMRRHAAWLADVSSGHDLLARLRWQALLVVRSVGRLEPGSLVLDGPLQAGLAQLLQSCMDLLALHPERQELRSQTASVQQQLHAFCRSLPGALDCATLDRKTLAAGQALQRRFASLRSKPALHEEVAAVFSAGAILCQPPDLRNTPHAIVPGDGPYPRLWNALLGLRARYAECRAIVAAAQDRTAEAIALLDRELIGGGDAPEDPARDVLVALEALADTLPGLCAAERDMLLAEIAELVQLSQSARLLQHPSACGVERMGASGPQLHRLLLVLEVLQLCSAAGVPLARVASLAPGVLTSQISVALMATGGCRQS